MEKNFSICPHCFVKGKDRVIRPATPHRTPLVSRSDGTSFHLFVEESQVGRAPTGPNFEVVALSRYDLDPAGIKAESALVRIPVATTDSQAATEALEEAADRLGGILGGGAPLKRLYGPTDIGMHDKAKSA
jgi:hypothetical protein